MYFIFAGYQVHKPITVATHNQILHIAAQNTISRVATHSLFTLIHNP